MNFIAVWYVKSLFYVPYTHFVSEGRIPRNSSQYFWQQIPQLGTHNNQKFQQFLAETPK